MGFPEGFLWETATAATQVEGGLTNHDWYHWAAGGNTKDSSTPLKACQYYHLYREDLDLLSELEDNAYRFGIEWARVEPRPGEFSEEGIAFYRKLLAGLQERGIEPVVTLHHFTNPTWFAKMGGWEKSSNLSYFREYCRKVVREFAPFVKYWVIINEPTVYVYQGYLEGNWPPGKKGKLFKALKVLKNRAGANEMVYRDLHDFYQKNKLSAPAAGIAHHLRIMNPASHSISVRNASRLLDYFFNWRFVNKTIKNGAADFFGLNYYSRDLVALSLKNPATFFTKTVEKEELPRNELGWEIYPEGLYRLIKN